jgi:Na+/proline symporter
MKNSLRTAALVATLALSALPARAGGFAEPRIEPEVMAPDTVIAQTAAASAPGGIIVPLILLALIAAVGLANAGSGGAAPIPPCVPPFCGGPA